MNQGSLSGGGDCESQPSLSVRQLWGFCLQTTQSDAAIDEVAEGNWFIIMYGDTLWSEKGKHRRRSALDVFANTGL